MIAIITLSIGFILGLFTHIITMKISFKQRTIDNKIKVYDAIIASWVKMRNRILHAEMSRKWIILDQIYGDSQTFIGEIFLITENDTLAIDINNFNEEFYRQNWSNFNLDETNIKLEEIKSKGLKLVERMRSDIQSSTVLNRKDFIVFGKV